MSIYETNAVASFMDKAADVGNKDAALRTQDILQAQKDRIDGQLAEEIVALKAAGEVSSEKYRLLLSETTALSTAISAAKAEASVAAIKEERLDLANMAPQGGERLIAQADAKLYSHLRDGIEHLGSRGMKSNFDIEVPLPAIKQDVRSGKNVVVPVKAVAPQGEDETSLEASYMAYEAALRNEFTANATVGTNSLVVPTMVVDLISYLVTYERLFNKFRVYQTPGVSDLVINRLTGVGMAAIISKAGVVTGEREDVPVNNVTTSDVTLRALKAAGLTRITPELVASLPADMLQSRIASYLAESLGLRFAFDAVQGPANSDIRGVGVKPYLVANAATTNLVNNIPGTLPVANLNRQVLTSLFGKIGGAYQGIVNGLTLAMHSQTFWHLWSNIQDSDPLFTNSRGYDGSRLGPWEVCIDDAFDRPTRVNGTAFTADQVPVAAGDFMRGWAIRYGGALRLNVSNEESFTTDQITIRAIQHFDTQPAEVPAVAALQVKA